MSAGVSVLPKIAPAPAPAPEPIPALRPAATPTPATVIARTGFSTADQFQRPVPVPVAITTPQPPPSAPADLLTSHMTSDQSQAFAQLPPADQQTLRDFAQTWARQMESGKGSGIPGVSEGLTGMRAAILSGQGATLANLARTVAASDQKSGGQNAQQALVNALHNGQALTKPDPHTGKSLLQELSALNRSGQTYLGYDRSGLAVNILTDLFTSSGISQVKGEQDCSALAIAASMRRNPASYARMIIDLANGNKVMLPRGEKVEWEGDRFDPKSTKSMTNQLFDAGMRTPLRSDLRTGVTGEQVKDALKEVYGGSWTAMYTPDETEEKDPARRQEAQDMAVTIMDAQFWNGQQPLFANYNGHWYQVCWSTSVSGSDKVVTATAQDGTGEKNIPLPEFLAHLDGLVFPSDLTVPQWKQTPADGTGEQDNPLSRFLDGLANRSTLTVPKWMQNPAWADPGGGGPLGTQGSDDRSRR
ncbi:MAG TPA: hypothetical protein VIG99_08840 [Myxococcaceae bacterium]